MLELRCICGSEAKHGYLLYCVKCVKSQHADCYYPNVAPKETPDGHICLHCEQIAGDIREPAIPQGAKLRQAGQMLCLWYGDLEARGADRDGEVLLSSSWDVAMSVMVTLTHLLSGGPWAHRLERDVRRRMLSHGDWALGLLSGEESFEVNVDGAGHEGPQVGSTVGECSAEDFTDEVVRIVRMLTDLLQALVQ